MPIDPRTKNGTDVDVVKNQNFFGNKKNCISEKETRNTATSIKQAFSIVQAFTKPKTRGNLPNITKTKNVKGNCHSDNFQLLYYTTNRPNLIKIILAIFHF